MQTAKEFLDAELKKYETWKQVSNTSIKQLFESEAVWRNTKAKGVGQTTLLKFLGGNWKQWMIQEAFLENCRNCSCRRGDESVGLLL